MTQALGTWYEYPNSKLPVYNGPLASAIFAASGPQAIIAAWSGGTLNTDDHKLIVWGGGHTDYAGNEVYSFDLVAGQWTELTQPSNPAAYNGSGLMPDGNPASRHTYDGLTYIPGIKKMFSAGGSIYSSGNGTDQTCLFDIATNTWVQKAPNSLITGYGNVAEYDSQTGHVFVTTSDRNGINEYNPATDTWTQHGVDFHWPINVAGAIDPTHRLMVVVGGGYLNVADLTAFTIAQVSAVGDLTAQNGAPGIVYYPPKDCFIAWVGGSTIYALQKGTWKWIAIPAAAGNTVTPPAATPNGMYGRVQYDAVIDLFVVFTDINADVFAFKIDPASINFAGATLASPVTVVNLNGTTAGPFQTAQQAHDAAQDGATLNYAAGTYTDSAVFTKSIKLIGSGTRIQSGALVEGGVGTFSVHSPNFTMDGIEGFGCRGDGSASFVRVQAECQSATFGAGMNLHDNDMGILSGNNNSTQIIALSGGTYGGNGAAINFGHAHDVYIGACGSATVNGTKFTGCTNGGHCLKSRALKTTVSGCTFDTGATDTSRLIDLPWGGITLISGNILKQGLTENNEIIGVGQELPSTDAAIRSHSTAINNNTTSSVHSSYDLVRSASPAPITLIGNTFHMPAGTVFTFLGNTVTA